MEPKGQLQYFRSPVDGNLHPCAVCATDTSDSPKPLILEVSPGAINNLRAAVELTEDIVRIASRHGKSCVALRPTGRGPGTVYQNHGEVDVLEAIEHAAVNYPIDRSRISITGSSMGGAATWFLISHYPDLFAAAAPFCGYCDYQLWEKPGGFTFHMHDWEEPSWKAGSAANLVENLEHTPVWMVHGEWDRAVGGGVSVEHSRQMARLMKEKGYDFKYTEVPETGHGCRMPEIWDQVVPWLLDQKKTQSPDQISHTTYTLRHNRAFWATIEQLSEYGQRGSIRAQAKENRIQIQTENIRSFTLGPRSESQLSVDGSEIEAPQLSASQTFRKEGTIWSARQVSSGDDQKRHAAPGPIGDLFYEGLVLVPGTADSKESTFFNAWAARDARGYFRKRNGGVHRGGIMGENTVDLPIINHTDLSEEDRVSKNLLLYGSPESNMIFARHEQNLPVRFENRTIHLADKSYTGDRVAILAIFPHCDRDTGYIAVHGGVTPDAITWGSHLDMQLLPDYIVYDGGEVLDWGFWGNDWKSQ